MACFNRYQTIIKSDHGHERTLELDIWRRPSGRSDGPSDVGPHGQEADAETVRIDNTEHATRILIDNIVEPLKKELSATRREMARLRKAIDGANDCLHRADCPVLHELRELPKTGPELDDGENRVRRGQRKVRASGAGDGGPPGIGADVENSGS